MPRILPLVCLCLGPGWIVSAGFAQSAPSPAPVVASNATIEQGGDNAQPSWWDEIQQWKEHPRLFLKPKARDQAIIGDNLTAFDTKFLNRWRIPFVGVSNLERAQLREEQTQRNNYVDEAKANIELLQQIDAALARRHRQDYYDTIYRWNQQRQWRPGGENSSR